MEGGGEVGESQAKGDKKRWKINLNQSKFTSS